MTDFYPHFRAEQRAVVANPLPEHEFIRGCCAQIKNPTRKFNAPAYVCEVEEMPNCALSIVLYALELEPLAATVETAPVKAALDTPANLTKNKKRSASWTPERRAKQAQIMRERHALQSPKPVKAEPVLSEKERLRREKISATMRAKKGNQSAPVHATPVAAPLIEPEPEKAPPIEVSARPRPLQIGDRARVLTGNYTANNSADWLTEGEIVEIYDCKFRVLDPKNRERGNIQNKREAIGGWWLSASALERIEREVAN